MDLARQPLLKRASLLALAVLNAGPALATCPSFGLQPRSTLATGNGPVEVVAADFTGDGIPDLVTGHYFSSSLGLFPGIAPGGTFGSRIDISVGSTPQALATADLDGNGKPDLVVACTGSDVVQVLRGLGGGSFAAPVSFPAGSKPYEIALGDFNEDGVLDVAVADNAEPSMRIMLGGNDGSGHWNGSFSLSAPYATSDLSLGITTGDFNEDGITDVVATEYSSNTVALFLGNGSGGVGDGTFQPATHTASGVIPYDLATGDFNHDGHLDLVVANSGDGGVHLLFGSGTGSFPTWSALLAGVNCSGVAPTDLDGDGITDLLASTAVGPNLLFMLRGQGSGGHGDGTFAAPVTLEDCCYATHVAALDLDLDGKPDAVTCEWTSNTLSVFMDGCAPNANPPVITRIRDVPNDQGGKVFVTWTRSALDVPGGAVNGYRVWRQIPPGSLSADALAAHVSVASALDPALLRRELRAAANGTTEIVYWEALATLPAQRLEGYGYTATTPQDSMHASPGYFTYRISALTSNIDLFYDSEPDSGYSVDNLPPFKPAGLTADAAAGGLHLTWQANTDTDLLHYELYRSTSAPFTPSAATLVATPETNEFTDVLPSSPMTYMLAAVDKHENLSTWATLETQQVTGVGSGRTGTTWLAAPSPNPGHGALEFQFALSRPGPASLVLLDAQGRRVRTLLAGTQPAGERSLHWDGRDDGGHALGAGLYWLELKAGRERLIRRLSLVR